MGTYANSGISKNTESRGIFTGIVIMTIGIWMIITPIMLCADMMKWGYASWFIGLFIVIIGIVVAIMYTYRYTIMQKILNKTDILAHWEYERKEYEKQIRLEFEERRNQNRVLLFIILFFLIVFTTIFLVIGFSSGEEDSMGIFASMMIGFGVIITVVAYVAPYLMLKRAQIVNSETIISKCGLYHSGYLHTWNKPFAKIRKVEVNGKYLIFTIAYLTRVGWIKYEDYSVKIPIPEGEIETANKITDYFSR